LNREIFEVRHSADWSLLERLVTRPAGRKARKAALPATSLPPLTPLDEARLPELHRRVCHHLALARQRRYGTDLEERLNGLALAAHDRLYARRPVSLTEAARFVVATFPRRVREERWLVLLAVALLVVPALAMWAAALADPELAGSVVSPEQASTIAENFGPDSIRVRSARSDFAMFGFYVRNNIGVAFRTFASGLFFGAGALFFLAYNGIFFGAIAGQISNLGYERDFYSFVIGHGSFEITGIILSGAAGLRLGFSLLFPGDLTRGAALRAAGKRGLPLVGGAGAYLVFAAIIEAFWSASSAFSPAVKLWTGALLWLIVFSHLVFGGRIRGT
jgi:uncharacterized membrane protein SpoIIM required for sporulation